MLNRNLHSHRDRIFEAAAAAVAAAARGFVIGKSIAASISDVNAATTQPSRTNKFNVTHRAARSRWRDANEAGRVHPHKGNVSAAPFLISQIGFRCARFKPALAFALLHPPGIAERNFTGLMEFTRRPKERVRARALLRLGAGI
jgi:hypothetical protein